MRIKTQARHQLLRSGESGFTMIVTLVVLFVSSLLMAAAFAAANGDIHLTANDTAAKRAYYAAQAGISNYAFHLDKDFNYWTYCTGGAAASNTALNLVGETPLKTRAVPGVTDEKYAIQLLPASTAPVADKKCDPVNPVGTMIENHAVNGGTFRIQSTGYSGGEKRTILATFAHTSFLNFLYYTQYETLDPNTYTPPEPACEAYAPRPPQCTSIQFVSADVINGPMHTEDRASICGEPTFGRGPEDTIEFLRGSEAGGGGCSNSAIYKGTLIPPAEAKSFEPPPTNAALKSIAGTKYEGKTEILLTGETMTVTEHKGAGAPTEKTTVGVPFPANGVIYVTNKACAKTYTPYNPSYTTDSECGNIYVSGKYTGSLTIGAENDIVINGNLEPPVEAKGEPTTNAVLGLVANNFVRVYHPLSGGPRGSTFGNCNGSSNGPGYMPNPAIYAAILAVNHSFIVDNFDCGAPMEKLNVHGAIAQIFRGTVGTHNGNVVATGYAKNYLYDNRLEVESPPYFLNPIAASWSVKRAVLTPSP